MSRFNSQDRPLQSGLIPVGLAFCLMFTATRVEGGMITAGSGVTSADLLCSHLSSPELQGWNLARAAVATSTRGCLFVDFESMNRELGIRISGLLLSTRTLEQRFVLDTSSSSSVAGGGARGGRGVLFFCGSDCTLSPCVAAWIRAMKLGFLSAVPPEELLRPPRD